MANDATGQERYFEIADPQKEEQRLMGTNYLLAIGINTYQHITPLTNCVRDTKDFVEILTSDYGFDPDHVVELYDEAATRNQILEAFESLSDTLTEHDNLLIYFAGHGYYKESNSIGCLVPVDAEMGSIWTLIYNSVIRDYIKGIPAHHIFLIVDSCFSGDLILRSAESDEISRATEAYADQVDTKPSRWGLAAGRIEQVADGIAGNNSPFNKALVTFLKTHHANKFAVSELISHVSKITTYNADQTPIGGVLNKSGHQGGEFVFRRGGGQPGPYRPHIRNRPRPVSSNATNRKTQVRPSSARSNPKPTPKGALYGGGVLVLGLLTWLASTQLGKSVSGIPAEEFTLTLVVKEEGEKPVRETLGKIQVLLGDKDLGTHTLNENGTVILPNIAPTYLDSLVAIRFEQPINILSPEAQTPRMGKRMAFVIRPQGTTVTGRVVEKAGKNNIVGVEGAILNFGMGGKRDTTDGNGEFSIELNQAEGDPIQIQIYHEGQLRLDRREIVSSLEPKTLMLESK